MKRIGVLAAALVAALCVSTADAHMLKQRRGESQQRYYERQVHHGRTAIDWARKYRHPRRRSIVRDHRWLLGTFSAKLLPAHNALWECIHDDEAAWDNPGVYWTGAKSPYYGGLQMTWGWMGIIDGPAHRLSPLEQKRAAERGYRESGYSRAWLFGQWPNTAPPCLHLA